MRTPTNVLELFDLKFQVTIEDDLDHRAPWQEYDGHGVVTDWVYTSRLDDDDEPNQDDYQNPEKFLPLNHDDGATRFYDVRESLARAEADQWGLSDAGMERLRLELGKEPSADDVARRAVMDDYHFLRGWCRDEWSYVGVVVRLAESAVERSLWGIESNADEYLQEVAVELATEIVLSAEAAREVREQIEDGKTLLKKLEEARRLRGGTRLPRGTP